MGILSRIRRRLRRLAGLEAPYEGSFFGLNGLDRELAKRVDFRDGYYVELGANDGRRQSNTYHYELDKGWRGVLIEPIPHKFIECKRLRGEKNAVFCAACVPFDFPDRFVPMRYADLMTTTDGLTSLDQDDHFEAAQSHYDHSEAYEFAARARTITSILDEAGAPATIDLLSLDVEGAEVAVLQGLDQAKYRFRYILVETKDIAAIQAVLPDYRLIDQLSYHDYLLGS